MVFGFFKKRKPTLKLEAKQEIEIEFGEGDGRENFFTTLLQADKKRFTVKTPQKGNKYYRCSIGDEVTIVTCDEGFVYTSRTRILETRDKELDILLPEEIREEKITSTDNDFVIEAPVPVEFRAISTAHLQTALTREVSSRGIKIVTNLPIPRDTTLYMEMAIPDSPMVKLKGKVVESRKLPPDNKKSLTDIEFEDLGQKEKESIFRYTILFNCRRMRKQQSAQR
jgi:hypothetical protein